LRESSYEHDRSIMSSTLRSTRCDVANEHEVMPMTQQAHVPTVRRSFDAWRAWALRRPSLVRISASVSKKKHAATSADIAAQARLPSIQTIFSGRTQASN
jgi:hypothetical protein